MNSKYHQNRYNGQAKSMESCNKETTKLLTHKFIFFDLYPFNESSMYFCGNKETIHTDHTKTHEIWNAFLICNHYQFTSLWYLYCKLSVVVFSCLWNYFFVSCILWNYFFKKFGMLTWNYEEEEFIILFTYTFFLFGIRLWVSIACRPAMRVTYEVYFIFAILQTDITRQELKEPK